MVTLPTSSEISQIEWDNEKTTGAYSGEVEDFDSAVWLTLDVTAGKSYYLYAQSFAYFVNEPWVSVYNAAGELITEMRYSSLAELTLSPTATGRLYIELKNSSGFPGMMDFIVTETAATRSFDDDADTGDDSYTGTYGERIFGFWGDDSIQIGTGSDASGGRGDDYIVGNASANRIWGDHGEDYLTAQGGNDLVWGGTGQDQIFGGDGDDQLFGGDDFDQIYGGSANDRIFGGAGSDLLGGDAGNDYINGGVGNDRMRGGADDDRYFVNAVGDVTIENVDEGTDTVAASLSWTLADNIERLELQGIGDINGTGNALNNHITGNSGANVISGRDGNDYLIGGGGTDKIYGGADNDTLIGDAGNDTLSGGDGNDRVYGGAGADQVYGGLGADTFIFRSHTDSTPTSRDTIHDFSRSQGDKIDLSVVDARAGTAGDQAFTFIGTANFSGAEGQLRYTVSGTTALVYGDINGDKISDFHFQVKPTSSLLATDFVL
jgi:Ca2+-binding RTX toxin-like protein